MLVNLTFLDFIQKLIGREPLSSDLWEETHVPKVVGSNLKTVYWMDILYHGVLMEIRV